MTGQARHVGEVDEVAREIIGLVLDVDPDVVKVDLAIEIPESVRLAWEESKTLAARAREEESRAAVLAREVVRALRSDGLTQKDAGRRPRLRREGSVGSCRERAHELSGPGLRSSGTDIVR